MKIKHTLAVCCLLSFIMSGSLATAQDDLPEEQKAIACIDLRLKKLRNSEMASQLRLEEAIAEMLENEGPSLPIDANKIDRIFGAASLPGTLEESMGFTPRAPLPLNFFVELQFADEASADAILQDMPTEETVENGGKTFFVLGPENVWLNRKSPTTLVIGTQDFLIREYRDVFASNLRAVWEKSGDAPIRVAIDMKTRVDFLRELMEMAKQDTPPMFAPMIDVIDNAESLSVAIDLDVSDFFALHAVGIDEDNAEELRGVVDGLLGMAKMTAGESIAEMRREVPNMADAAQKIMDDLKATGDGREVNIVLTKPEGLDDIIAEAMVAAQSGAKRIKKLNRIRQVCLAMHNHQDAYTKLPFDPANNPRINNTISWRVHLLPFLEQSNLYDQLTLSEAVDADANAEFAEKMPELFGTDGKNTDIVTIKLDEYPKRLESITDGTSGTIVMLEYPPGKPWMERNDITIDDAVELFAALGEGEQLAAAFYDGSVRYIKAGIPEEMLRNLLDPADGNLIDWEGLDQWSGR